MKMVEKKNTMVDGTGGQYGGQAMQPKEKH